MTGTLELQGLKITLGDRTLVDLTLSIPAGEIVTIMGPSGAGKSTALAAITGTLAPGFRISGRILMNGKDISALPTRARSIGLLFQDAVLFPHLSVGHNLAFALPAHVRGRANRQARVDDALASAGLTGFAPRDPATLSGGQKARVALLRTLLAEPCALLLDEPFSRLDADLRAQIRSFVFDRAAQAGIPTLLVTHDIEDARAAAGPVVDTFGNPLPL
jgi:putative thiamine transport system ATP-binding protein